jgi:serine/threonine-protein kinase
MANRISRKMSAWSSLAACALGSLLASHARAEASASQKAAAEALFDDGVKAMRGGHFADACPKLEESEHIDPGIGTLLYLGECYEKTGRTASAWATFREAASTAQAQGESERAHIATARADRLQAALSKLTVRVAAENAQVPGLRVARDTVPLANSQLGSAVPVDPGKYHITASADGYDPFEVDVEVAPNGDSKLLDIPPLKASARRVFGARARYTPPPGSAAGESAVPVSSSADTSAAVQGSPGARTAAYVVGAVGVAALGVGTYFGVRALSKNSSAEKHCPSDETCDAAGLSYTDQAKHAAVASNIAIAVGAAFVVTGVVLYLSSEPRREARLQLHPLLTRESAGIGFGGAFQ